MRTCLMVIVTNFHQNLSNGSWDKLCWQKEEEEEEERKKNARETGHIRLQRMCKELDIAAVIDGVSCRLWDFDPWLTPGCLLIPQMW